MINGWLYLFPRHLGVRPLWSQHLPLLGIPFSQVLSGRLQGGALHFPELGWGRSGCPQDPRVGSETRSCSDLASFTSQLQPPSLTHPSPSQFLEMLRMPEILLAAEVGHRPTYHRTPRTHPPLLFLASSGPRPSPQLFPQVIFH